MKYANLHKKTIYDFTTEAEVIDNITAGRSEAEYLANLTENPVNNGFDLEELAELTGNKELAAAVAEQYKDDFAKFFNE